MIGPDYSLYWKLKIDSLRSGLVSLLHQGYAIFILIAVLLITSIVNARACNAQAAEEKQQGTLNIVMKPPFGFINTLENVKFSVIVLKRPEDVIDTVRLVQADAEGNPIAEAGVMSDDGQNGDLRAEDGQYTSMLTFNESKPVTQYYQAIVSLKDDSRQIRSRVEPFYITEEPYTKNPDEDKLVLGLGYPFPVNQAIVLLNENETKATAQTLVDLVGGKIVGYTPPINEYLLEVPATTVEELDAIIEKLERDPRVTAAMRNISAELE